VGDQVLTAAGRKLQKTIQKTVSINWQPQTR